MALMPAPSPTEPQISQMPQIPFHLWNLWFVRVSWLRPAQREPGLREPAEAADERRDGRHELVRREAGVERALPAPVLAGDGEEGGLLRVEGGARLRLDVQQGRHVVRLQRGAEPGQQPLGGL